MRPLEARGFHGETSAADRAGMTRADQIAQDRALMRRLAAGDEQAARLLVSRYARPIAAFAGGILNDAAEGEDIAHEAIMRLWRGAADWRPEGLVFGWLRRSAYTLAIDRLRRTRRFVGEGAEAILEQTEDTRSSPETEALGGELGVAIRKALARLPERQRAAILLAHNDGLSGEEIAEALDTSAEAVESLLSRARRTLRHTLKATYQDVR
jgi:RNA polymerase sigma-70 factor, ECF subfamily